MTRALSILLVFVMMFGLVACGTMEAEVPDAPVKEAPAVEQEPEPTPEPDPWETFASEEEAEAAAGFEIRLPDVENATVTYNVMTGGDPVILEAVFAKEKEVVFTVRKAAGTGNISGDETEYSYTEEVVIRKDILNAELRGEGENDIRLALWTQSKEDGDYTYSIAFAENTADRSGATKAVNAVAEDLPKGYTYGINKAIAAGRDHTVALKKDGTVVATGVNSYGMCDVSEWTDIVAVAAGELHTVGLKSDGTVVGVGANNAKQLEGIEDWTNIVAIACTYNTTYGFCKDGTVLCAGGWMDDSTVNRDMVNGLTNIIDANKFIFLDDEGRVYASGPRAGIVNLNWDDMDIVSVASFKSQGVGMGANTHYYAILSDGSVIAKDCWGSAVNTTETREIEEWFGAAKIAGGYGHAAALMPDGMVRGEGFNLYGQINTSEWEDVIDISALMYTTVGLKSDGTVVAVGDNNHGQCDVSEWTNIGFPDMDEPDNTIVKLSFDDLLETVEETVDTEETTIEENTESTSNNEA